MDEAISSQLKHLREKSRKRRKILTQCFCLTEGQTLREVLNITESYPHPTVSPLPPQKGRTIRHSNSKHTNKCSSEATKDSSPYSSRTSHHSTSNSSRSRSKNRKRDRYSSRRSDSPRLKSLSFLDHLSTAITVSHRNQGNQKRAIQL